VRGHKRVRQVAWQHMSGFAAEAYSCSAALTYSMGESVYKLPTATVLCARLLLGEIPKALDIPSIHTMALLWNEQPPTWMLRHAPPLVAVHVLVRLLTIPELRAISTLRTFNQGRKTCGGHCFDLSAAG
jgi:hypothetical protein